MAKLTIRGTHPQLDGEYELDLTNNSFTKAEYYLMKKNVGVVVGDMQAGMPIDMNLLTAWGLVALRRAGKEHLFPVYMDTTEEQAQWEFPEDEVAEDDALPPASPQPKPTGSGPGDVVTLHERNEPSGPSTSSGSDDSQEIPPQAIGSQP